MTPASPFDLVARLAVGEKAALGRNPSEEVASGVLQELGGLGKQHTCRMILASIEKHVSGDNPRAAAVRAHLHHVCSQFINSGLADPKFVSELGTGADQTFWSCVSEALVASRLVGKVFGQRQKVGEGPDFLVMDGDRRVWIEVVCPDPVDLPAEWLEPSKSGVIRFPHQEILLRWTSAISTKADRLLGSIDGARKGYLASEVVGPQDTYVIAVNGCRLRSGPFPALMGISQFPFAAEAVFPIGPYQVKIDRESFEVVERGHQHRPYLLNRNRSEVSVLTFLEPRFRPISAIWGVDFNGEAAIGYSEPSVLVHNPYAINPVRPHFLPADNEYVALSNGGELVLCKRPVMAS